MPFTGTFIVFEGIDHSGKSTQIKNLKDYLESQGHEVVLTHAPGDAGVMGSSLRQIMSNTKGINPVTRAFMMAADASQQMRDIVIPALDSGKIVLSDRSTFSMWAYQGGGHGMDIQDLRLLSKLVMDEHWPDLVIWLDLSLENWTMRKKHDDPDANIEDSSLDFINRVRDGYIGYVFNSGYATRARRVSSDRSKQEVYEEIIALVDKVLGSSRVSNNV